MEGFIEMNQKEAKTLQSEGGTFVFLDVPVGTEFGIDMNVFHIGEKFRGIKMIPPGVHFVFYSSVSKDGLSTAPRTGFFHYFKPHELLVRKYDKKAEDIHDEDVPEDEIERIRASLQGDLDKYLGPYPYKTWKTWVGLTTYLSEPLLLRLMPDKTIINSVTQFVPLKYPPEQKCDASPSAQGSSKRMSLEDRLLPNLEVVPGTQIKFTKIPDRYPVNATPAEITTHCMDSTFQLDRLLESYDGWENVLGELQMAFVSFLVGQVYDAFEQWKCLVNCLVTCDSALEKYVELYSALITVLHFQIKEVPSDYFVDIVSCNNFLTQTLQVFFMNLGNSKTDEALKLKGERFKRNLTKMLNWDFDYEPEDEAPVVVETGI